MSADENTRAIVSAMRDIERAHAAEEKPYQWTEADIAGIYGGNAEVERLTSPPAVDPEVARYLGL